MENSDSGSEGDESEAQGRSQMDQAVQEEDFYQFVNNPSKDDYKPMRDNDLLGNPGEELCRRRLPSKENLEENSDESTDEGDREDDASSSDSLLDWLMSFEPTERVTAGQREQPPRREVSQVNLPSDFRSSSEINVNFPNEGPSAREVDTPSTRLPTRGNVKKGQRQVECPQSEPRFTRPPRSEQSRTGASLEVPPTRGQKRERSRSPDQSRTRARPESTPLPRSLGLLHPQRPQHSPYFLRSGSATDQPNSATRTGNGKTGQREHQHGRDVSQFKPPSDFRSSSEINVNFPNEGPSAREVDTPSTRLPTGGNVKRGQRQVECPQSEPRFTRPPRSEQCRTRALLEVPPTRGQQTTRSRSQDQSRTRVSTESKSPAQSLGELLPRLHHSASSLTFEQPMVHETERFSRTQHHETSRQQIPTRGLQKRVVFANSETRDAIQGESSPDTTSEGQSCHLRQMNPTTAFYSGTGRVHPVAYSERESVTRRDQIPSETPNHTITLETEQEGFRDVFSHYEQGDVSAYISTFRIPIYRTLNTSLNDTTSGAIPNMLSPADFSDSRSLLDSDSDSESSFSPPSSNTSSSGSDSSHGSRGSSSNSVSSWDYYPPFMMISSSDISFTSSSASSPMSSSSSSDESSEPLTVFESSDEGDVDHPTGLSEAQIDNLAIRSSVKNDVLNECSICITEYREGSQLRILPCSHEFHVHCIDRWLSDNSTCPICRQNVVDSGERENTN